MSDRTLVSLSEIARRMAVRPSAVGNWRNRHDFPAPAIVSADGSVSLWDWWLVKDWADVRGLPGRSTKGTGKRERVIKRDELVLILRRAPLGLSLRETGRLLGLSHEQVRQIEKGAR